MAEKHVCRACLLAWFFGATPEKPPETMTVEQLFALDYAFDTREECEAHAAKVHGLSGPMVSLKIQNKILEGEHMELKLKPTGVGSALRDWLKAMSVLAGVLLVLTEVMYLAAGDSGWYILIDCLLALETVAVFILSIVHLRKYKEKGLAVTMLVLSSLFILFFTLAFLTGVLIGLLELGVA